MDFRKDLRSYGTEPWTVMIKNWMRVQAVEMEFLRSVKGCSKI
jgi:hypothetical protein